MLIYENGEGYKIVGVKEGCDIFDYFRKKHDKLLEDDRGTLEISGDIHQMEDHIILNEDYSLTYDEDMKYD